MATMDLEDALKYKLATTAGVIALIFDARRIYPATVPDVFTPPAITFLEVSAADDTTHDSLAGAELVNGRYQFDAWGTSQASARALGKAIYAAFHGFTGTVTDGVDSLTFGPILRVAKRAQYDPGTRLYTISQDFMIWYME